MASRNPIVRLQHIRTEIHFLTEYVSDTNAKQFVGSPLLLRAAERSLLIISEAAKSLPEDLTARYPDIDWRKMADLGNVLRHDYNRVDAETILNIVKTNIPLLAPVIEQMIVDTG